MKSTYFLFSGVLLTSMLPSQQTVPPGYLSTESTGSSAYAYRLGGYAASRQQIANGDLKGGRPITMSELSVRQDGSIASSSAVGRSWSNVSLHMGETDLAKFSRTWSTNYLTKPTQVFSAALKWPDLTKNPTGSPEPWDMGTLKMPFSSKFVYSGTNDLMFDFEFTGGKLANGGAWGTSTLKTYYLDGRSILTSRQGSLSIFGLPASNGQNTCQYDSGNVLTNRSQGPYGYFVAYAEDNTGNPAVDKTFRSFSFFTNGPKSSNVFQGLSLGGTTSQTTPGPIPGLGCQPLFLDLTKLFLVRGIKTNTTGTYSEASQRSKFLAAAVGVQIWSQFIFDDTVTKSPKMSWGSRMTIPALPPKPDFAGMQTYRYASASGIPSTGFTPFSQRIPLFRIK